MNIFKNILFLPGYPTHARSADEADHSYAQGYGNRIASAKAFAPLGRVRAIERRAVSASNRAAPFANDLCPLGACG